jgi:hypothetical protein
VRAALAWVALAGLLHLGAGAPARAQARYVLPSEEAYPLIADLLSIKKNVRQAAAQRLAAEGDLSLLAPVVDMVFFIPRSNRAAALGVLEELTGESHESYYDWVELVGAREGIRPRPDYWEWKRLLLMRIDPKYGDVLAGDPPRSIRLEEIVSGGVPLAGIPALDEPPVMPGRRARYLEEEERVFGVEIDGAARAYPLRFLSWHELMNDVLAGRPITLSYCTLCGSGILYDGRRPEGGPYTFDTSGLLYRSNKLMIDRQGLTLWSNLTGTPVLGRDLGQPGLEMLPMTLTTWKAWFAEHPETEVLDLKALEKKPIAGIRFDYTPKAADRARAGVRFPVWRKSKALEESTEIYALVAGGVPKAYPLDALLASDAVNDRVGGVPLVLVPDASGGAVRVFERGERSFHLDAQGRLVDESGNVWQVAESQLLPGPGAAAEPLPRIPGHVAYWFGWFAFYPNTEVFTSE